ncbi:P-loop containing nucleoside triphosphate hydrolase protein [Schizophyllum fasciatum]
MSTSGKPSTDPANPTESHAESADRHNANKARSAANLDEARRRATQKRNYNSDATRSRLRELFAETWHCEPRSWQIDITEAILLGLDSVLIAGTGSGKTMPFMLTLKYDTAATVLVISPLKILQEDQACRFCAAGIPSCAVNGDTYGAVRKDLESMQYRALLTSPEMCLETDSFRKFLTSPGLQKSVRAVIIDEAHCIAQWGGDFRKHYGMLHKLRALFPATVPFLAATATLPPLALKEVCDKLHIDLDESYFVNLGNDRHNISQHVRFINSARDYSALKDLLSVDAQERKDLVKTIVFVNSRNGTQEVCREVRRLLPRRLRRYVDFLHAVRKDWTKRKIMQRFRRGRIRILIATEAAGMGADIPDIIQVIQLGAPSSLSVYLQRAGRAVRDVVLQGRAFLLVEKSAFKLQKRKPPKKKAADDCQMAWGKVIHPSLRTYITHPSCRRDTSDAYFDNPPRQRRKSWVHE